MDRKVVAEMMPEGNSMTNALVAENKNMKRLLAEMLPDMKARVEGLQEAWPGRDVLTALHRNERFVAEIERFTDGFGEPAEIGER